MVGTAGIEPTAAVDLIAQDPHDTKNLWTLRRRANARERRLYVEIAKTILNMQEV